MMLAHSRNRRQQQIRVSRVNTRGETTWKQTAGLAIGSAIGGILMYNGRVMSGAGVMLGTLLVGGLLDKDT